MPEIDFKEKLPTAFYLNDTRYVAKKLIGKILVKKETKTLYAGRIVETEAYKEKNDGAAHSFNGKTERNKVMFEQGGVLYVYFTYGAHFCCNVVTGKEGVGDAVLIRAVEPVKGIEKMVLNRYKHSLENKRELYNLTSGPGKLCKAYNIIREDNGINLTGDYIFIVDSKVKSKIVTATRIGIKKSVDLPWRFYLDKNPFVSRL